VVGRETIDLVLDVGAHRGAYARQLRQAGYRGRMVSFEPLSRPYGELENASANDPLWDARRLALGERSGRARIHRAGNSVSTSLLEMTERHVDAMPSSAPVGAEEVQLARLDEICEDVVGTAERLFVKLDVQGYEGRVLDGATETMARVRAIELEMSLVELYGGQPLLPAVFERLVADGFECVGLEPAFTDRRTGYVLQVDGLFVRPPVR